jgi:hypothetical protein
VWGGRGWGAVGEGGGGRRGRRTMAILSASARCEGPDGARPCMAARILVRSSVGDTRTFTLQGEGAGRRGARAFPRAHGAPRAARRAPGASEGQHAHRALRVVLNLHAAQARGCVVLCIQPRRRVVAVAHEVRRVQAAGQARRTRESRGLARAETHGCAAGRGRVHRGWRPSRRGAAGADAFAAHARHVGRRRTHHTIVVSSGISSNHGDCTC